VDEERATDDPSPFLVTRRRVLFVVAPFYVASSRIAAASRLQL
jgi:hypothetical protein